MDVIAGQSLEMSLAQDSPPPLAQVEGKVESLDSATYLGKPYCAHCTGQIIDQVKKWLILYILFNIFI